MLFSVIYYILLGLTEIIKFLFGHFFAFIYWLADYFINSIRSLLSIGIWGISRGWGCPEFSAPRVSVNRFMLLADNFIL